MIELLEYVDRSEVIESSCLIKGKDIVASSFPSAHKGFEAVAKQAFSYIFMNVSRTKSKHDEAHLHIGDYRLSAFLVQKYTVLVCLSDKEYSIQQVHDEVLAARKALSGQPFAQKSA